MYSDTQLRVDGSHSLNEFCPELNIKKTSAADGFLPDVSFAEGGFWRRGTTVDFFVQGLFDAFSSRACSEREWLI